jgi:tRNA pseudouridine38-40 synthase
VTHATAPTRTLRLDVAYDGTDYVGWQRQENGLSVQQLVEDALQTFCRPGDPPPSVMGASRTDAGVHASGQVASVRVPFDAPPGAVQRALNIRLPADVRVLDVTEALPSFHARFDATSKQYRYRILTAPVQSPFVRRYVWHLPYRADLDAMQAAAAALVGRYDFASFQARGASTLDSIRTITRVDVERSGDEIQIVVDGTGFVRHMVRIMVGSLVEVASRRRPAAWLAEALAARDREAAGPTAPAAGLTLEHVRY